MKTIVFYLLLMLVFNVFSDDAAPIISDSINFDSLNTDSSLTNSDNNMPNIESSLTNSDNSLSNIDSSLLNSDINMPNTESLPKNSDITLSTIDHSNGNETQSSAPIYSVKPRIILLGFGLFQRPIRSLVTFKVYFKRFLTIISPRFLYFTVNLNYLRRLRVLKEKKTNCTLITADDDDDMTYNCSVPVDENKDLIMSANDDFEFEGLNPDLIISSYAKSTMKSLSYQKGISLKKVF